MNSFRLVRKCLPLTLIQHDLVLICRQGFGTNKINISQANTMSMNGDKSRNYPNTRSYTKSSQAQERKMPLVVGHDKSEKEFYIKMTEDEPKKSDAKAILTYEWQRPKFVDLQHTFVPEEFRGRGVAKLLAETAFEHFTSEGATMKLSCSYLQKYAIDNENPRYSGNICWD